MQSECIISSVPTAITDPVSHIPAASNQYRDSTHVLNAPAITSTSLHVYMIGANAGHQYHWDNLKGTKYLQVNGTIVQNVM